MHGNNFDYDSMRATIEGIVCVYIVYVYYC